MNFKKLLGTATATLLVSALFSACTTQQQQQQKRPTATESPTSIVRKGDYGPSYITYEERGTRWTKGSIAFPTGMRETSGLLLEKIVPAEINVGQSFEYTYHLINLTDCPLQDVMLMDGLSSAFVPAQIDPKPEKIEGKIATWRIGSMAPEERKVVKVVGTADAEGTITSCGWATFTPVLCEPVKVVKPALQLVKRAPAEVLLCDPIPMTLTVRNSGSSGLTNVRVVDTLPDGLTSGGQRSVSFDAGSLAPGQSKDFTVNATASRVGSFVNVAKATSGQGIEAEASATTIVRQAVLALACDAPETRFIGRPFHVCFTVTNRGNAASANTIVEAMLPTGLTVSSATGATAAPGKLTWNIGTLATNATRRVCATVVAANAGALQFAATATATCASAVNIACRTTIQGIPAILLEVVDVEDPIEVGKNVTYVIDVTNQGSAVGTNIKLVCTLENAQDFVSGTGVTAVTASGKTITMAPVASLAAKQKVTWRVTVKASAAENIRFKTSMTSDQLTRPVEETESTNQY